MDSYKLIPIDYKLCAIDSERTLKFNNHFEERIACKIIGIRGYWLGNQMINFNIVEVLVVPSKKYDDFISIQLVNSVNKYDSPYIIAHDLLCPTPAKSIYFFNLNSDIYDIDQNKFITESIMSYVKKSEENAKELLSQQFLQSSDFKLASIEYNTLITINVEEPDLKYLSHLINLRNMKLVSGAGIWRDYNTFIITSLVFSSDKNETSEVTKIEKNYKKSVSTDNQVLIQSKDYNINLTLTLSHEVT